MWNIIDNYVVDDDLLVYNLWILSRFELFVWTWSSCPSLQLCSLPAEA